jgi:hypothetical protein
VSLFTKYSCKGKQAKYKGLGVGVAILSPFFITSLCY